MFVYRDHSLLLCVGVRLRGVTVPEARQFTENTLLWTCY